MSTHRGGRSRILALRWPALVCLVTALFVVVRALVDPDFFMRGDTAAQFAPTWFHLGELVRDGQWPPQLDPDSWVGGNYAAEALFGIYNPVSLLIWVFVSLMPNLMVAVLVVKAFALVMLALGTYCVSRDHGAEPWAAAALATALPISGYTLYWDAGSWAGGLIAFAYVPWVWWAFRRTLQRRLNPFWAFVIGSLAVTQGNPYGTLGVAVIGFALLVEAAVARDWRGGRRLVLVGVCVAAWLPLVYLPLIETADLAIRSGGLLFSNNGKLRPELGDLFGLSSPTYTPGIRAITGPMQVPAVYFSWFVLPLLPWLRFDVLRSRAREFVGAAVIGLAYLVLTLGPSKLWLFRWPVRQVEYLYLAVAVVFAVVLSQGLRRDRVRARLAGSALLVGLTSWLTWAEDPALVRVAVGGPVLLVLLTGILMTAHLRRAGPRLLTAILVGGSGIVLLAQAVVFGENASSRVWHFPHDVSMLEQRFADRDGTTMQFADLMPRQRPGRDQELRESWRYFLAGSMYHVAGVEAVNNYSGMGYEPFTKRLCLHYDGLTRSCGYRQVWDPVAEGEPSLAELMKLETIVVQRNLAPEVTPPTGWTSERRGQAVILTLEEPGPYPGSHLSWVTEDVEIVEAARTVDAHHEQVGVSTGPAGGEAVFAMLDWPGYTASLDGEPLAITHDRAGLLTVELPSNASGTLEVSFRPPGLALGLSLAGLGTLGAAVLGAISLRSRGAGASGRGSRHTSR